MAFSLGFLSLRVEWSTCFHRGLLCPFSTVSPQSSVPLQRCLFALYSQQEHRSWTCTWFLAFPPEAMVMFGSVLLLRTTSESMVLLQLESVLISPSSWTPKPQLYNVTCKPSQTLMATFTLNLQSLSTILNMGRLRHTGEGWLPRTP